MIRETASAVARQRERDMDRDTLRRTGGRNQAGGASGTIFEPLCSPPEPSRDFEPASVRGCCTEGQILELPTVFGYKEGSRHFPGGRLTRIRAVLMLGSLLMASCRLHAAPALDPNLV